MSWDFTQAISVGILPRLPALAVWTAVLVFGIVLTHKNGGRAEKFITVGGAIKLAGIILTVIFQYSNLWWYFENGIIETFSTVSEITGWLVQIISMAGYLCLLYAFWLKTTETKQPLPEILPSSSETESVSH